MVRQKSRQVLDTDSTGTARPRLGRPKYLSDAQLHNRREQLVQAFESHWSRVGWEFQKCKNPADLIEIFSSFANIYLRDVVSVFVRPSTVAPSGAHLRKVRAEHRAIVTRRYRADELLREPKEHWEQTGLALAQAASADRRIVRTEWKNSRKAYARAAQAYRNISEREQQLLSQIRDLEASFARQELFQFLKSKRYEVTPLNLANAAAGLPDKGWRRSMFLCRKARSIIANTTVYETFKAVRYLVITAKARTESALLNRFRSGIPSLPSRYGRAKKKLAEEWLYVERAIRQACKAKPHPKAFPFEIMKSYQQQIQSPSHADVVLAQLARLKGKSVNHGKML
jgi:hypothetical protein